MLKYQLLFDAVYEQAGRVSANERKRFARSMANDLLTAIQTSPGSEQMSLVEEKLRRQLGDRAALSIVKTAHTLKEAPVRRVRWSPGSQPKFALITSAMTAKQANELSELLQRTGADCWVYTRSIRIGRRIHKEDEQALIHSDYVVALLSRQALQSNFVDFEIDIVHWLEMRDRRERLLPVIIDDLPFSELPASLGILRAISVKELGFGGVVDEIIKRVREDRRRAKKGG